MGNVTKGPRSRRVAAFALFIAAAVLVDGALAWQLFFSPDPAATPLGRAYTALNEQADPATRVADCCLACSG